MEWRQPTILSASSLTDVHPVGAHSVARQTNRCVSFVTETRGPVHGVRSDRLPRPAALVGEPTARCRGQELRGRRQTGRPQLGIGPCEAQGVGPGVEHVEGESVFAMWPAQQNRRDPIFDRVLEISYGANPFGALIDDSRPRQELDAAGDPKESIGLGDASGATDAPTMKGLWFVSAADPKGSGGDQGPQVLPPGRHCDVGEHTVPMVDGAELRPPGQRGRAELV
jgi:hypothetical protein